MIEIAKRFVSNESGATAIEYCMIAGIVSIVMVVALMQIGTKVNNKFTPVSAALN